MRGAAGALVVLASVASAGIAIAGGPTPAKKCADHAEAAQRLRSAGKLRAAKEGFALCTASVCPAVIRRDCGKWLEQLEAAIPTLVFRVLDASGAEVTDAQVEIDGELVTDRVTGRAVPADPGEHTVVLTRGAARVAESILVHEGERNRSVVLRLPGAAQKPESRSGETPAQPGQPPLAAPPAQEAPAGDRSALPWILGGVGIVAAGVGAGLWIAGSSAHSDLESSCAATHTCSAADVSNARTQLVVGDILVGAGLALVAGGVILLVTGSTSPPPPVTAHGLRFTW